MAQKAFVPLVSPLLLLSHIGPAWSALLHRFQSQSSDAVATNRTTRITGATLELTPIAGGASTAVFQDGTVADGANIWWDRSHTFFDSVGTSGIPSGTPFWSANHYPPYYGTFHVTATESGTLYLFSWTNPSMSGGLEITYANIALGTMSWGDGTTLYPMATYAMQVAGGTSVTIEWPTDSHGNSHSWATSFCGGFAWGPPVTPSAAGDPHLQNVHGERFDLMKPGTHVLVNIPREESAENALLRVEARASKLGGQCEDIYFTELNITGSWAHAKQTGGYHFLAQQETDGTGKWVAMGKVELKIVHGHTETGTQYLNFYVKHLGRTGFAVGGLLGEEDHSDVSTPPAECVQRMSLEKPRARERGSGSLATAVAIASFE